MNSVIFLMGSWNAPSEHFLYRQIKMLHEEGLLESIIAANLYGNTSWEDVPVYGLSNVHPSDVNSTSNVKPDSQYQNVQLAHILSKARSNTVLCQYGTMAVLFSRVLQEIPHRLFIHVHGKDTQEHLHSPQYKSEFEHLAKRAIIICSPHVSERLESWDIPRNRIFVKNYGVEIPVEPVQRDSSDLILILHVGRFVDCKSPERTIKAFEYACDHGLAGKLVMIGDGPLKSFCDELRLKSAWCNSIYLPGYLPQEDVDEYFQKADIFTQHSIKGEKTGLIEAFGVSIVEAMASALPVVSCSIGGIKYIIEDGKTGILVEPGDVVGQGEAFIELAQWPHKRKEMGISGWRRAKEHYSYDQEKKRLIAILNGDTRENYIA